MQSAIFNSVMNGARSALGQGIGTPPSPMPPLRDPQNNWDSEIQPADLNWTPEEPRADERQIVEFVTKRKKEAINAQKNQLPVWFNSWSFSRGEQWRTWDKAQNRFMDTKPGPGMTGYNSGRRYRTYNHIEPLVTGIKAKVSANMPAPGVAPLTGMPSDLGAAREVRAILAHCDSIHDVEAERAELFDWTLNVAAPYVKVYWDPTKTAAIPQFGPDGQIISIEDVENAGDIVRQILSPFEGLPDPKAKRWELMAYFFHNQIVPLSYVQEHYAKGWQVKPDARVADEAGIDARMAAITGDADRSTAGKMDGCLLCEMWEKASPRYPKGRLITIAGDILLDYREEWPDGDGKKYPFAPLYCKKSVGSIYGRNAVSGAIDGQILINKAMSKIEEWTDEAHWYIMAERGSETGKDAFKVARDKFMTTVFYNTGRRPPQFMPTPPMNNDYANLAAMGESFLRDFIGIHEVSEGKTPAGIDTGIAIQLLQQSDDTITRPFLDNIAEFHRHVAEIEYEIAKNKYSEARLLMVQDTQLTDPDAPRAQVMQFQHLSSGRVSITRGAATAETPIVRAQRIMDMAGKGMFAPPMIPATIALLGELGVEQSDKLADDLRTALQQILAQQPSPADLQAQQAQQAQQAMQMQMQAKLQLETALEQIRTQGEIQVHQAKAQGAAALAQLQGAIQEHLAHIDGAIKAATDIAVAHVPKMTGAAKIVDPVAVASMEERFGLDHSNPGAIDKQQTKLLAPKAATPPASPAPPKRPVNKSQQPRRR